MAYLDTTRVAQQPKLAGWRKTATKTSPPKPEDFARTSLQREIDRHIHQAQEMLLVGSLAAATIIAVALVMLSRI